MSYVRVPFTKINSVRERDGWEGGKEKGGEEGVIVRALVLGLDCSRSHDSPVRTYEPRV